MRYQNKPLFTLASFALLSLLPACAGTQTATDPPPAEAPAPEQADSGTGTLQILANGEDFVRQGFVTKDGWEIDFEHVYVNLADITASQTDPPYDPEAGGELQAKQQVQVDGVKTIDLAEGNENAEPILVGEVEAPAGRYNALSWRMVNGGADPANASAIVVQGIATKGGETVNFTLNLDQELAFSCGDFVGDQRKGVLQPDGTADLEATFHFDHLFGDGDAPPDDAINTGALGFDPLAALAENGQLTANTAFLQENLSAQDYALLLGILPSLGHVGEGHCAETQLAT